MSSSRRTLILVLMLAALWAITSAESCGDSGGASGGGERNADGSGGCESGYDPCVPSYPPDVDCPDVDGPISVSGSDPHGLDADNDGTGCEPY